MSRWLCCFLGELELESNIQLDDIRRTERFNAKISQLIYSLPKSIMELNYKTPRTQFLKNYQKQQLTILKNTFNSTHA